MSNVEITKWHENATTDKLNVNPPLIREEVSLILRRLEVVHSLPPPDNFEPSENQAMKCSPHRPEKHKLVNMRCLSPLSPRHAYPGWGGGLGGF